MKLKSLLFIFILAILFQNKVQAQDEQVLFTIDDELVYTSEFIRVYNKNLDLVKDESQKDIDGYLKLFINYKLKLNEAKRLKLDKKSSYLQEFQNYKKQLAKNYLSDSKVTDALVEEAYNRLQTEINASHVLVRIDPEANPKDTLAAYNTIVKLRERVLNEGYKQVQKDVHNGKTIFAEDLGYFTAFKMVYPFESAAYNTAEGEVSKPFRTRFGYHVLTVFNKRKARGQVSVAHIMIKNNPDNNKESEAKINDIYKRYKQGEAFDALAKQFSEDQSTASKGGMLKPFSSGEISAVKFEEVAFGLKNIEDVSKPFKTQFGWHIVMLKDKKDIAPLAEMKPQLQTKIKKDSRSKVINESRIKTLYNKYTIKEDDDALNYFKSILTSDYFKNKYILPTDFSRDSELVKIQDKSIIFAEFGQYLIKNQRNYFNKNVSFSTVIDDSYKRFVEAELLRYQEDNLINENKDYAQIVGEYRDGLLLFDLMETEIWNVAKNDSVALKEFYNNNKTDYFFPERIQATVASSPKKSVLKKIHKLLNKGLDVEAIKTKVNVNNQVNVTFTSGEMDKSHQAIPEKFKFKKGISKIIKHNDAYILVDVKEILPQTLQNFEEAKGKVTSDYQSFKESNWLKNLANKYTININEDVLKNVKQNLGK